MKVNVIVASGEVSTILFAVWLLTSCSTLDKHF